MRGKTGRTWQQSDTFVTFVAVHVPIQKHIFKLVQWLGREGWVFRMGWTCLVVLASKASTETESERVRDSEPVT